MILLASVEQDYTLRLVFECIFCVTPVHFAISPPPTYTPLFRAVDPTVHISLSVPRFTIHTISILHFVVVHIKVALL